MTKIETVFEIEMDGERFPVIICDGDGNCGYIAGVEADGEEFCLSWYGEGERFPSADAAIASVCAETIRADLERWERIDAQERRAIPSPAEEDEIIVRGEIA